MNNSNTCIYRYINTGRCCCFKTKKKYCNIHINNRNSIYEIINEATDNKNRLNNNDIYKIYKYIYNKDDIYVKELIFKTILKTIYNNKINILINLIPINDYNNYKKKNKEYIYNKVYEINKNTYDYSLKIQERTIIKLQDIFRLNIIKKHFYNPNLNINFNNEVDPFTFDNINDINDNEKFIINDGNNYYCFKALELLYFIENKGNNWNPYTKKEFDKTILKNLKLFIKYNNLNNNYNNNWNSVLQAYTDVSQALEKIGFYNNTEWFLKLTSRQIKNIIRLYKIMSNNDENYFNNNDIKDDTIFYDFAREIIKLFEDGNSHFLLCCNFIKALSMYSNDFFNNLPEWMTDIENPIQMSNLSNYSNSSNNIFYRLINNIDIVYLINIMEN